MVKSGHNGLYSGEPLQQMNDEYRRFPGINTLEHMETHSRKPMASKTGSFRSVLFDNQGTACLPPVTSMHACYLDISQWHLGPD